MISMKKLNDLFYTFLVVFIGTSSDPLLFLFNCIKRRVMYLDIMLVCAPVVSEL